MAHERSTAEFPSTLEQVPAARAHVNEVLDRLGCGGDPREVSGLLVTELVANAIKHGQGEVSLTVEVQPPGRLRVTVRDEGEGQPSLKRPDPLDPSGGRGLLLVDAFAEDWGVDYADRGKAVWFEIPVADPNAN